MNNVSLPSEPYLMINLNLNILVCLISLTGLSLQGFSWPLVYGGGGGGGMSRSVLIFGKNFSL